MIKAIEFCKDTLRLTIDTCPPTSAAKGQCGIKFHLGEGGRITEFHRGKFVDFVQAVDSVAAVEVGNFLLELLRTDSTITCVDLYLFHSGGESL